MCRWCPWPCQTGATADLRMVCSERRIRRERPFETSGSVCDVKKFS
jgi:hypothetical protein